MRKIIVILVFLIYSSLEARGSEFFKFENDNVIVYISSFSHREEMNKGIIIGEYVNKLCEAYNYSDSIEIFLEMTSINKPEYNFLKKGHIFLYVKSLEFNVLDVLKLTEYAIENGIRNNYKIGDLLKKATSSNLNKIMEIEIVRPKLIKELENYSGYSYFFSKNKYYVFNKRNNEILKEFDSIYLFAETAIHRPLIFLNKVDFAFIDSNNNLKYNTLPRGMVLYEHSSIEDLNGFLILCVYDKNIRKKTIAVLHKENNTFLDLSTLLRQDKIK